MAERFVIADPLVALLDIVGHLEAVGSPYAIGGSVASSVHGEPRASANAAAGSMPETYFYDHGSQRYLAWAYPSVKGTG